MLLLPYYIYTILYVILMKEWYIAWQWIGNLLKYP